MEDKEIVSRTSGLGAWLNLARLMELIELTSGNLIRISPHFQCNVISTDPDDRAFTDCAIAANPDYIITEDAKQRFSLAGEPPKPASACGKNSPVLIHGGPTDSMFMAIWMHWIRPWFSAAQMGG